MNKPDKIEEKPVISQEIVSFLSDLILLTTFAKRKGVSKDAVYYNIRNGRIKEDDLIWIDIYQYIRWSQYKDFSFKDHALSKTSKRASKR